MYLCRMEKNATYKFASEHLNDNIDKLLLKRETYPDIDMSVAVTQIQARRTIKEKLPQWYANNDLRYPSKLSTEQCSSETTATYKATLLRGNSLCDLTGGLGVDCVAFSKLAKKVDYFERFPEYCMAAEHNFATLQCNNITIHNCDFREELNNIEADTLYLDPARRGSNAQRLFSLNDYEPNVIELKKELLERCKRLIIKVSPMADITAICKDFPEINEIHIVSVKNECKEILLVIDNNSSAIKIVTLNFDQNSRAQRVEFTHPDNTTTSYALNPLTFLYEPNVSIMKSGAFNQLARLYTVLPLSRNSHLYTADNRVENFPGRRFQIVSTHNFTSKWAKNARRLFPKANITVRNFPLSVAELRKNTKIGEGGDIYLFATTTSQNEKIIIECRKL